MATVTVKRGDTLALVFHCLDADGDPQPLTECSARLQLRAKVGTGTTVYAEATTDGGELVIDAPIGTVTLTLPFADTEDLPIQTYESDLELTFPGGERVSSETFQIKILKDITRDQPA